MTMKLYTEEDIQAIANAIRTQNGSSDTYKVSEMADAILDISGGSSPWVLLDTITVPEDTRTIDIDVTPYTSNYDCLFCYGDVTLSATDWLYIVKNGTSASGGSYTNGKRTHFTGIMFMIGRMFGNDSAKFTGMYYSNTGIGSTGGAATNFYLYAYTATSVMKAGSTLKIYGVNYSSL